MSQTPTAVRQRTRQTGGRGTVLVERTVRQNGEEATTTSPSREIEEKVELANPAYVSVNGGLTKNMGDYNSVKIGVSVSLPSGTSDEELRETYQRASALVDEFMDGEYRAAIEDVGDRD